MLVRRKMISENCSSLTFFFFFYLMSSSAGFHRVFVDMFENKSKSVNSLILLFLFVLRFYGPVNPMGSCRARSVYLSTRLLGRVSPLSG